ncbi:MAG: 4Fe-4S dicluster domain-containing protein [Acidobacteriota bacterium]
MIRVEINGNKFETEKEVTILQACEKLGIPIPTLCYHPLLEPYAACRVCVVEITHRGATKIVTSCNTMIENGMIVNTESPEALSARRMNLELLMAQAPAAEVVQQIAKDMGIEKTRFPIRKPEEKCILCGLCVRACEQVVGANAIGFKYRGVDREVAPPFDEPSEKCITCGACTFFCPTGAISLNDFFGRKIIHSELFLGPPKAIRVPTLTAVPNVPIIDPEYCIHFKTNNCQLCVKVCEPGAIDHAMKEEYEEIEVGNIVLSTGYELFDCRKIPAYNYGKLNNVITSLEFEHLCHASGPTGGKIKTTDGKEPEAIGVVHCVGSRDKNYHEYCSKICCMYALKFSHLIREKTNAHIYEFYIDMRAPGKGYEEFYNRMLQEGVTFIRGKVAEITDVALIPEEEGKLVIRCEDTLAGVIRRIPVDMAVLCPAIIPRKDSEQVARIFGIGCGNDKFFREQHPKLGPISTLTDGIFIAGACQSPKDIPESIAQGAGAAAGVLSMGEEFIIEPIYAVIDEELCAGCKICIGVCPYDAISYNGEKKISVVNETLCKGCGACVAACPSRSSYQKGFRDEQILAEIAGAISI